MTPSGYVSQTDGAGAASDPGAGSRDFQADRRSRDHGLQLTFIGLDLWPRRISSLAQKLVEGGERFDRVILDKKIESRERYMKLLPRLCKQSRR